MSVTTTGPVNPAQVLSQLGRPRATLRIEGDPSNAGASVSSQEIPDAEIQTALAAIVYDPNFALGPV